jgi:hypothetical protein
VEHGFDGQLLDAHGLPGSDRSIVGRDVLLREARAGPLDHGREVVLGADAGIREDLRAHLRGADLLAIGVVSVTLRPRPRSGGFVAQEFGSPFPRKEFSELSLRRIGDAG